MKQLYYEWKIHFSYLYFVPVVILGVLLVNLWQTAVNPYFEAQLRELYYVLEIYWPLTLALGLSTLLPQEYETGMLKLRLSYPQGYKSAILQKLMLPVLWWLAIGMLAGWWAHQYYLAFDIWDMLIVVVPPTVFLGGLALLASAYFLNSIISMLITLLWWAWELLTAGVRSGNLALLPYSFNNTVNIAIGRNRAILIILGIAFGYLAMIVIEKQDGSHNSCN